jgi:hypothetical protein
MTQLTEEHPIFAAISFITAAIAMWVPATSFVLICILVIVTISFLSW